MRHGIGRLDPRKRYGPKQARTVSPVGCVWLSIREALGFFLLPHDPRPGSSRPAAPPSGRWILPFPMNHAKAVTTTDDPRSPRSLNLTKQEISLKPHQNPASRRNQVAATGAPRFFDALGGYTDFDTTIYLITYYAHNSRGPTAGEPRDAAIFRQLGSTSSGLYEVYGGAVAPSGRSSGRCTEDDLPYIDSEAIRNPVLAPEWGR